MTRMGSMVALMVVKSTMLQTGDTKVRNEASQHNIGGGGNSLGEHDGESFVSPRLDPLS